MIFQKIARLLKSEINGNSWHVGDLLPSEAELAVRSNVSRNTLRKALSLLEGEGIIHRKHGSGTYIQKKNFVAHIDHMNSFSEIAHKSGKEAGSQIMKFEVQDASPTIATELNLVTGEQVYYIKRLRFIEDNAAQLEETWMSVARFPDLTVSHMQKSKFSYIENECGIKIIGTFETFSPTFPTPEIASILRISPRDPILKIQTQAVDSNSIPLDYSLLYSNIFEFQVKYFFPR
ncbi:TPA: GntR family transcriptional regulator [Escherichia coli]|nr:GntR family transcriptional regulator [Escherichia coli]